MTTLAPPRPVHPASEAISILRGLDPGEVQDHYGCDLVYLIHLDKPLRIGRIVFRHYIGFTHKGNLVQRMIDHRTGSKGSKFLKLARRRGITWHLARVWPGDRKEERRIKNMGGASRSCPSCGIVPAAERQASREYRGANGRYITTRGRAA